MDLVLVHGAWLGAWCWEAVADGLRKQGHTVAVPELPGHGSDRTPLSQVSLDSYVQKVIDSTHAPAVLVGHSMAGAVISHTAESVPEKIQHLVFVAAYLLRNSESITNVSQMTDDSLVPANMAFAPDYRTVKIRRDGLRDVFCADASADSAEVKQVLKGASKAKSASLSEADAAANVIALAVSWKAAPRHSQSDQHRSYRQSAHRLYESCETVARYGSLRRIWRRAGRSMGAPSARLGKAFNTTGFENMQNPKFGDVAATTFYAGDDKEAKKLVRQLISDLGFDPVDAGPLAQAHALEVLASLSRGSAYGQQMGRGIAFRLHRR